MEVSWPSVDDLDVYADLFDDDLEAVADRLDEIARSAGKLRAREIVASLDERRTSV